MAKQTRKHEEEVLFDLVEAGQSTQNFLEKYQTLFLSVVFGILVLVGAFFAYKMLYLEPLNKDAINEMYRAELQFEQDSFALALENPGEGYKGFLDIIEEYGSTKAGNLANYYAGVSYLRLGRYDAAIAYLEDFSPAGDVTPILKYGALGDCYSELGEMDKAISAYEESIDSEDNEFLSPYYMKKLALLHRALKNYDNADTYFRIIKEKYPNSSFAQDLDKYISVK